MEKYEIYLATRTENRGEVGHYENSTQEPNKRHIDIQRYRSFAGHGHRSLALKEYNGNFQKRRIHRKLGFGRHSRILGNGRITGLEFRISL